MSYNLHSYEKGSTHVWIFLRFVRFIFVRKATCNSSSRCEEIDAWTWILVFSLEVTSRQVVLHTIIRARDFSVVVIDRVPFIVAPTVLTRAALAGLVFRASQFLLPAATCFIVKRGHKRKI